MPPIFLDGEPVIFQGPFPEDLPAVFHQLENYVQSQGHPLWHFRVDGQEYGGAPHSNFPAAYRHIEALSHFSAPYFQEDRSQVQAYLNQLQPQIAFFSGALLAYPYRIILQNIDEFGQKLAPVLACLGRTQLYAQRYRPEWKERLEHLIEAYAQETFTFYQLLKAREMAALSDQVANQLLPLLAQTEVFLSQAHPHPCSL